MGIDLSVKNHLDHCLSYGNFGETITMGRQEILPEANITKYSGWCEEMLKSEYGATSVASMDFSNYEGATILHDLNVKLKDGEMSKYDTVLDLGTLEHVYNISNALFNLSKLCKVGGQIVHVLPTNQQCGHGFWQISPELFFSLYSEKNGYGQTRVYTADVPTGQLCKREKPKTGKRLNIQTKNATYVVVRTVLDTENWSHQNIQQSDYVATWQ